MKKKLLHSILYLLIPFGLSAQHSEKHEFSLSFGLNAREYEDLNLIQNLRSVFTFEPFLIPLDGSNTLMTRYRQQVKPRVALGVALGIASNSRDRQILDYFKPKSTVIGAIECRITYMNRPKLKLYATGGIGAILTTGYSTSPDSKYTRFTPAAIHLSPIGLRYGKSFGAFIEAGYGYNGIGNIGLSYKF